MSERAVAQYSGLSDRVVERIDDVERTFEAEMRADVPDFRLIRDINDVDPEIDQRFVPVEIVLADGQQSILDAPGAPPLIVTAHDRRSGKPLLSCTAPCTLASPRIPPAMIVFYRYGSKPKYIGAEHYIFRDDLDPYLLRFNEVDHLENWKACRDTFEDIRATVTDADATPCVRIGPEVPDAAMQSGRCKMVFDISTTGEPINVFAESCTDVIYCDASQEAVNRWIYHPKLEAGEVKIRPGVETTVRFMIETVGGEVTPEPEDGLTSICVGTV